MYGRKYDKSSLTVVPNTHGMVERLLRQLLLCEIMDLLCDVGVVQHQSRQVGMLVLVHTCKTLLETARYCSPSMSEVLSVLSLVRHLVLDRCDIVSPEYELVQSKNKIDTS